VTHGEPAAADALRRRIAEQLHWRVCVPAYLETVEIPEAPTPPHSASAEPQTASR
jgi:metallo-beta-lactamase family protein